MSYDPPRSNSASQAWLLAVPAAALVVAASVFAAINNNPDNVARGKAFLTEEGYEDVTGGEAMTLNPGCGRGASALQYDATYRGRPAEPVVCFKSSRIYFPNQRNSI